MKTYTVTWSLSVEQDDEDKEPINTPVKAVEECWKRLQSHSNDWIWQVCDEGGVIYEVNYDNLPAGVFPNVTVINK